MNRIEAFNALFGSNQGTTASKEAVDVLADNLCPTANEEAVIDTEALDNVSDFVDNPVAYLARFPDGRVKSLLQGYLDARESTPAESTQESAPEPAVAVKVPAPEAPSIPLDPMATLTASRPPIQPKATTASAKTADLSPRTSRKPTEERGFDDSTKHMDLKPGRGRQPREEQRPQARVQETPPDPPAPLSPITLELKAMLDDPLWVAMRDQICRAHEVNDQATLLRFRTMADSFKTGANANSGPRRLIGQLMILLLADLKNDLNTKTPAEFIKRYWS